MRSAHPLCIWLMIRTLSWLHAAPVEQRRRIIGHDNLLCTVVLAHALAEKFRSSNRVHSRRGAPRTRSHSVSGNLVCPAWIGMRTKRKIGTRLQALIRRGGEGVRRRG